MKLVKEESEHLVEKVEKGELVEEPDVPKNGSYQFVGWYIDKDETDLDNYYDKDKLYRYFNIRW